MTHTEFEKARERYLRSLVALNKSESTIEKYTIVLNRIGADLDEITPEALDEWRDKQQNKANTTAHYLTIFHTFLKWCNKKNIISEVFEIEKPKPEQIEYNLLNKEDIDKIISGTSTKIHKENYCRNRAIVLLLLQTGMRNGEIRALKVNDLDFGKGEITIRHGKGDKLRIVPFPQLSRDAVKAYLKERPKLPSEAPLFVNRTEQSFGGRSGEEWHGFTKQGLNALVSRYVYYLTGKEIHCHTLRHSAAAYWDENNVPIRRIQQALGHKSIRTTESVYLYILNKSQAAQDINTALDNRKD